MNEMSAGVQQINNAVQEVNELAQKNKDSIEGLAADDKTAYERRRGVRECADSGICLGCRVFLQCNVPRRSLPLWNDFKCDIHTCTVCAS